MNTHEVFGWLIIFGSINAVYILLNLWHCALLERKARRRKDKS